MDPHNYDGRSIAHEPDQWANKAPDVHSGDTNEDEHHASGAPSDVAFQDIDLAPGRTGLPNPYLLENRVNSDKASDTRYCLSTIDDGYSNETGLCKVCNSLPWKELSYTWYSQVGITMSKAQLAASRCRICRCMARTIEIQKLGHIGPYWLHVFREPEAIQKAMAALPMLDQSDIVQFLYLWGGSHGLRKMAPHLVVANASLEDKSVEKRYYHANHINVGQIKGWIQDCHMTHSENCNGDAQYSLRQLRVIDCGSKTVVNAPTRCHYVALSYVWGQHNDAFDDLQNPPKTIADSIHLTQMLGYRYLWVDRFCVHQDDPVDKHRQVRHMGDIYSAAQITLVAAAGNDPSYGLPGVLSRPRLVPESEKIQNMWLKPLPRCFQLAEVAESKWASRAWTFQEFYRSRRRLVFTENQVIFVCNSQIRYEIALSAINWPGSDGLSTEDGYWARRWLPQYGVARDERSIWTGIDRAAGHLQAYSNRDLTYDSDSLDAIAGALDSLREESVYHTWGALYRHAAVHAADSLSARLRHCNDACSVPEHGSLGSIGSRNSTDKDDNVLETVHVSGSQDFQSENYPLVPRKADQYSVIENGQQIEMALTWYHQRRARRRHGFPSWSSLGWEGPLSWYRQSSGNEESPILLSHARSARLHFPQFSYDLSKFNPALQESTDSAPPTLEFTARTAKLGLVLDGNRPQVALEMNEHYKYAFRLDWDADPTSLKAKQLVGALLDGRAGEKVEWFMMVLAPHGDVLERVGLVCLPMSRVFLSVDSMRRNDLMRLVGNVERAAADTLLQSYPWERDAWWQSVFGDYRPIVIG